MKDELFELKGAVPKRVRDAAFSMYLDYRKAGVEIPKPLQDYIDWGVKRTLDGERTPYPVTRSEKVNPYLVHLCVLGKLQIDGRNECQAVNEVAALFQIDERTVKETHKRLSEEPPNEITYYLSEIW